MNRRVFYDFYWKLESVITPGLKYSQSIYEEILNAHCDKCVRWLDLGCGHQLLPQWRHAQEKVLIENSEFIVGIDRDYLSLMKHNTLKNKVCGDITELPFQDNSFDLITSNMVFEHLNNPEMQLKEIQRVLSRNGKLIFHTPNNIGYGILISKVIGKITPVFVKHKLAHYLQGREEEDIFPTYYRINSPSKIRKLAKLSGFNIVKIRLLCSSAGFVMLPPIVLIELMWIKFLLSNKGKWLRTNIIAIFEKP